MHFSEMKIRRFFSHFRTVAGLFGGKFNKTRLDEPDPNCGLRIRNKEEMYKNITADEDSCWQEHVCFHVLRRICGKLDSPDLRSCEYERRKHSV